MDMMNGMNNGSSYANGGMNGMNSGMNGGMNGNFNQPSGPPPVPLREDQIVSALKFLRHESVANASREQKSAFLSKKGLTPEEVTEAFRRADSQPVMPAGPPPAALFNNPKLFAKLARCVPFRPPRRRGRRRRRS